MDDQLNVQTARISLRTLADIGAAEKFAAELDRVIANIADINTADGERNVTLKITIKPTKNRNFCDLKITATSKLQPEEGFESQMFMGKEGGKPIAEWLREHVPGVSVLA